MKIQNPKQRKIKNWFSQEFFKKQEMNSVGRCKGKSNEEAIHNLDEITIESCKLGMEQP